MMVNIKKLRARALTQDIEMDVLFSSLDGDLDEDEDETDAIHQFEMSLSSFMSSTGIYETPRTLPVEDYFEHYLVDQLAGRQRRSRVEENEFPTSSMDEVD